MLQWKPPKNTKFSKKSPFLKSHFLRTVCLTEKNRVPLKWSRQYEFREVSHDHIQMIFKKMSLQNLAYLFFLLMHVSGYSIRFFHQNKTKYGFKWNYFFLSVFELRLMQFFFKNNFCFSQMYIHFTTLWCIVWAFSYFKSNVIWK